MEECGEGVKAYGPTVIGLFAGCGGMDYGFKKAGFDILYANDVLKCVEETYRLNVGEIEIKSILDVDKNSLPEADLVLAGIPCQPFSNAENRWSTLSAASFEKRTKIVYNLNNLGVMVYLLYNE